MSSVGDGGHEAYTASVWGVRLSSEIKPCRGRDGKQRRRRHERSRYARDVALPESKTTSRPQGSRRNLGDLASDRTASCRPVRIGKGSVIGANAVVLTDIPPFSLAVGVPAVIKKSAINVDDYRNDVQAASAA